MPCAQEEEELWCMVLPLEAKYQVHFEKVCESRWYSFTMWTDSDQVRNVNFNPDESEMDGKMTYDCPSVTTHSMG